jgi:toxin ParE1/3/4
VTHKVRFAPEAIRDLTELYRYILRRSGEPTVALGYVERVRRWCLTLADHPERGTRRDDLRPNLRVLGFERRVAIAFSLADGEVRILRIAYGGRDLSRLLPLARS